MTDNKDEEELGNSTNTQSDNPSDEIMPTADLEAINSTQETENMEVHHHPDLHHKQKKWKEYFLEFLMIFLAVTMGFFAESYREHLLNKEKEKQFMGSLVEDLKLDIQNINITIDAQRNQINGKDTLVLLINNGINTQEQNTLFYELHWKYVGYPKTVSFSKRTLSQLLNSDGLRLVENKNVSDAIAIYASNETKIETVDQPANAELAHKSLDYSKQFIDTKYMRAEPKDDYVLVPSINPKVRNANTDALKDFSFSLEMDKENCIIRIQILQKQLELANELLDLLKKEYHIE
jgi:hypothetical protein